MYRRLFIFLRYVILMGLAFQGSVHADEYQAEMVSDLYLYISQMTAVNGQAYFTASSHDYGDGQGFWKSDGTAAGTQFITDVNSPDYGGTVTHYELTDVAGQLFLRTRNEPDSLGYELWASDGTENGTRLVKDINPGSDSSSPSYLSAYKDATDEEVVIFVANDSEHGQELWRSDGTGAGTYMIKDTNSGSSSGIVTSSYGHSYAVVNGIYYFRKYVSSYSGYDLWRSDGTEAGTYEAFDTTQVPYHLTSFNNSLYLSNSGNNTIGRELYRFDGTNMILVKDICLTIDDSACYISTNSSTPSNFVVTGNQMFFLASNKEYGRELWVTDGTTEGTQLVADLTPGTDSSHTKISEMTAFNGNLYFAFNDGVHGSELWRTDGTDSGTFMVKDIYDGSTGAIPEKLVVAGNHLYFVANSPGFGRELWMTDGTESGTRMVDDVFPGDVSSAPTLLTDINGTLFFRANYTYGQTRLWKVSIAPDAYEGDTSDDTQESATVILLNNDEPQAHNFHTAGDMDWVQFYAIGGRDYEILADNVGAQADIIISIYDSAGNLLVTINDTGQGGAEQLSWVPPQNGTYFLQVSEAENRFGQDTNYELKPYAKVVPGTYGIIRGIIASDLDASRLAGALVTSRYDNLADTYSLTTASGEYLLLTRIGTADVVSQLTGYQPASQTGITVTSGSDTIVNLDMVEMPQEVDADSDGIPDAEDAFENDPAAAVDSDLDGMPDDWNPGCILDCLSVTSLILDIDDDNDGLHDTDEQIQGTNPLVEDTDEDGLSDGDEINSGSDPLEPDTDGDGINDGDEVSTGRNPAVNEAAVVSLILSMMEEPDSDGDGVIDITDNCPIDANTDQLDTDGDSLGNACDDDIDGDGLSNAIEAQLDTDPTRADSDGDGTLDGEEDSDSDNLSNAEELVAGTDPSNADTDGDGVSDGAEVASGRNPTVNESAVISVILQMMDE